MPGTVVSRSLSLYSRSLILRYYRIAGAIYHFINRYISFFCAIPGVGHAAIAARFQFIQEEVDLGHVCPVAAYPPDLVIYIIGHSIYPVVLLKMLCRKLLCPLRRYINAIGHTYFLRILMRRLPDMIGFRAGRSHFPVQSMLLYLMPHQPFRYRRAADITQANHQYSHRVQR